MLPIMKTLAIGAILTLAVISVSCSRNEPPADATPAHTATHESHGATHDSHEGHAGLAAPPTLPAGQLWATDESLRAAMLRIRAAVEKTAPAYESGELQAADAQGLAAAVEENVRYMIANCKLEPEPDAALHVLIGRMLSAATSLKSDPGSSAGFPELLSVLQDYQSTFDHPGW